MRVLLFCQTGDGRPKCEGEWRTAPPNGLSLRDMLSHGGRWACRVRWISNVDAWVQYLSTRRWWLVECENAEAGRMVIHLTETGGVLSGRGRILASGGAGIYTSAEGKGTDALAACWSVRRLKP